MATTTPNIPPAIAPKSPSTRIRSVRPSTRKPTPVSPATPSKRASAPKGPVAPISEKEPKTKKPKLVRDSFTFPKDEYAAIEALKLRAAQLSHPAKKSEILRAGLKALLKMSDAALRSALQAVPAIKTGRPKSEK